MQLVHLRPWALLLPILTTACSGGSAELAPWQGDWVAIETYMRGPAFEPVAVEIQQRRPGYTVQEIQEVFAAFHDVDFTHLSIEDDELRFEASGTALCAGRYRPLDDHDHEVDDEAHDHGAGVRLELRRTLEGTCAPDFDTVAVDSLPIEALLDGQILLHFHLQAGAERAQPWSPGVIEHVDDEVFTTMQLENVDAYVAALPER